ncbi:MAG: hypothetical protein AAGE94_12235 [Acidobacteriota bacterium]
MSLDLDLRVVQGDATDVAADVLILKFAQRTYGLDGQVSDQVAARDGTVPRPAPGDADLRESPDGILAPHVLFVGTPPFAGFDYAAVRDLAHHALDWLGLHRPQTRSVVLTLHGVGFGLDEIEAFDSLLAGVLDAVERRGAPSGLRQVTIVERAKRRARAISRRFDELAADGALASVSRDRSRGTTRSLTVDGLQAPDSPSRGTTPSIDLDPLRRAGYGSAAKPHAFVAMPFSDELEDTYYYGIEPPVRDAGLLCERIDQSHFSGDIAQRIFDRIRSAKLLIADLTKANPNVYLELGYALGVGVPAILLVQDVEELRFDVQGRRCLIYGGSIRTLEKQLRAELAALGTELGIR